MTESVDQNKKKNVVIMTLSPQTIDVINKLTTSIDCLVDTLKKN